MYASCRISHNRMIIQPDATFLPLRFFAFFARLKKTK
jgi:hypothetical protein